MASLMWLGPVWRFPVLESMGAGGGGGGGGGELCLWLPWVARLCRVFTGGGFVQCFIWSMVQ